MSCCSNKDLIHYYLNDPSKKDFVAHVAVPENPPWKLRVKGYKGPGHDPASVAGQAAVCYVTLANALNYIVPMIPDGPKRWAAVRELLVLPRAGKDFNAFYNRKFLKFFYDKAPGTKKVVFTCESADIVAHELGHAVLDAMRPDFWNVQGKEGWAFHESFGDIMAILSVLQHEKVLAHAIQIDLNKSNVVSRLAEEMAAAVYALAKGKGGVRVDALRDASNQFTYTHPERLPGKAPANVISHECHSFSRIFTGAWYEMLVGIYEQNVAEGMPKLKALISARDTSCSLVIHGIQKAPKTVRLFDAIAKYMVKMSEDGKYHEVVKRVFKERKILRPRILMLQDMKPEDIVGGHEEIHALGKSVIVKKNEVIKMSDHMGISALSLNPLYNVDVEIPSEERYEFNQNGYMIDAIAPTRDDILDDVRLCLNFLNDEDLVGDGDDKPFAIVDGKLERTQFFACSGCSQTAVHQGNACDPNAPEYGKGHKGSNNAGRGSKGKDIDCTCPDTTPTPAPKNGCYVKVVKYGNTGVKICSKVSRTVC
jgi:hypothetical protein